MLMYILYIFEAYKFKQYIYYAHNKFKRKTEASNYFSFTKLKK